MFGRLNFKSFRSINESVKFDLRILIKRFYSLRLGCRNCCWSWRVL